MENLRRTLAQYKLDDSLLFINSVISVSRGELNDRRLARQISQLGLGQNLPVFAVHLIAKLLILEASNFGKKTIGWEELRRAIHYEPGKQLHDGWRIVMEHAEADGGRGEACPGVDDDAGFIVADAHSSQPFDPRDRPLDDPADATKMAAVTFLSAPDLRPDAEITQQAASRFAVVPGVGENFVGKLLRSPPLAADLRKVEDRRQDLRVVAGVRSGDANGQRRSVAIDHQRQLRPRLSPIDWARAGLRAAAMRPHDHAVDDGQTLRQLTGLLHRGEQRVVDLIPHAQALPGGESLASRLARAAHFRRHVAPATAALENPPDDLQRRDVIDRRATSLRSAPRQRRQKPQHEYRQIERQTIRQHGTPPSEQETVPARPAQTLCRKGCLSGST